jgi:S-adenosylmethionine-diacylglycerol 3-amino-3-carboxypropyl transferase
VARIVHASPPEVPPWVNAAATLPLAFAQVREDPRIDRRVVERCAAECGRLEVIQIASGGCTAAVLAALPQVARLQLVDPNPAQLALTRLKLWLARRHEPAARLTLLGHAEQSAAARGAELRAAFAVLALGDDCLGPLDLIATLGPDHAGRYEQVFAALRAQLAPWAPEVADLLSLHDVAEQRRRALPDAPLGRALDQAFAAAMALEHLVALFGAGATGNAAQPFHRHFAARLREALATLPAATNPYLWQLLRGTQPPGHALDWLAQPRCQEQAEIAWTQGTMDAALEGAAGRFHVVHLSNILDWLSPAEASRTLALAWRALRPGGRVVIRQLNSTLDIPRLGAAFRWDGAEAAALHGRDRSFFYRTLHLGRRP